MGRRCVLTGKGVRYGNNVSHAENKTRRRFNANLQRTSVFSDALQTPVRLRVSTRALRSIEHVGGIDAFLLKATATDLGLEMRRMRKRIEKAIARTSV
jgi:large subunit ribosomal protein L28